MLHSSYRLVLGGMNVTRHGICSCDFIFDLCGSHENVSCGMKTGKKITMMREEARKSHAVESTGRC